MPVPLRRRLMLLAAAGLVPLALMAGMALYWLAQQQRAQAAQGALELSRALAIVVDSELRDSISVLEAMSSSPLLDAPQIGDFHALSTRILATRPYWVAVVLTDPSGQQVMNTQFPHGSALPPLVERDSFARVLRHRQPTVGDLAKGAAGRWYFTVRVPVLRGGDLRYVLTAIVRPEGIVDVLGRQRVPADWVVAVFDRKLQRVARSREHAQFLGQPPSPALRRLIAQAPQQGYGPSRAVSGEDVHTAYVRAQDSGWTVGIGVPSSSVGQGLRGSLAAFVAGIVLSLALGILAAVFVARGIARPIGQLRSLAQAFGRREAVTVPPTRITEIREVGEALATAGDERARHEREREELLQREQQARAAAEAASRSKDEFLAMLGHELRNPLGAIANASRLLEHPQLDAGSGRQAREIIRRQVDHLARLTDDLLDAGRAVMGKIALQRAPLDLAALTAGTLATLSAAGRTAGHRIIPSLQPAWVDADPTRLEQIVTNLVVNAVRYTPAEASIRVSVRQEEGDAVLRVSDEGIGMAPELAARVFDVFVQGERGLDRQHGGLGIGLTLVRRIAELHGGSASVHSEGPGRGSEFVVRLPAIAPRPEAGAAPAPSAARSGRDVLVIEDNPDARETLGQLLALAGHRVRLAADGAAGVEAALAARPQVALVDIGLPKLDGYEVARRIRAEAGTPPFLVALTGYGLPEDRERALAAGFDAHLVKPVDFGELERLLAAAG